MSALRDRHGGKEGREDNQRDSQDHDIEEALQLVDREHVKTARRHLRQCPMPERTLAGVYAPSQSSAMLIL